MTCAYCELPDHRPDTIDDGKWPCPRCGHIWPIIEHVMPMQMDDLNPHNTGASQPSIDAAIAVWALDAFEPVRDRTDGDFTELGAHCARVIKSHTGVKAEMLMQYREEFKNCVEDYMLATTDHRRAELRPILEHCVRVLDDIWGVGMADGTPAYTYLQNVGTGL